MDVRIITTGGTIEDLDYGNDQDKPKNSNSLIKEFLKNANVIFDYTLDRAFSKDSRFIVSEDREVIGAKIRTSNEKKILITHGTITMVETAAYLASLDLNKCVVLVGSFILGSEKHTDAPFNLGFALCGLRFLENGVYIAMNGKVFPWNDVQKNQELNRFENRPVK